MRAFQVNVHLKPPPPRLRLKIKHKVDPVVAAKKALQAELQALWDALEAALVTLKGLGATAEPFLHEVSKTLAPNYYEVCVLRSRWS